MSLLKEFQCAGTGVDLDGQRYEVEDQSAGEEHYSQIDEKGISHQQANNEQRH